VAKSGALLLPSATGAAAARIDQARVHEIQQRYAGSTEEFAKYADVDRWLRVNRERVQDLKLHHSRPVRVLDLGCGSGFFCSS
jgi:2-polyprenyl-3-methyl-5-hydroxy-6-metoxy-1,4-benzoquinol methylase